MIQRFVLRETLVDKTRQEEILRNSDLLWTVLRPPQLTEDTRERGDLVTWTAGVLSDRKMSWKISRAALAKRALDVNEKHQWIRQAVNMSEPIP